LDLTEERSMPVDITRECAERLVGNSWDVYLADPNRLADGSRDWQAIADTILADGRKVALAYLAQNPKHGRCNACGWPNDDRGLCQRIGCCNND
jgi:hypothetical protein